MAMSVSPGSRSSPGFCHNRRQGKRSAQKQIICPIYRGLASGRPYRLGLEPAFFAPAGRMRHPQGVRADSLLERYLNTANLAGTCPCRRPRQGRNFDGKAEIWDYSAARADNVLGVSAETMKS